MELLLHDLHTRGLHCAPHVVARLAAALAADAPSVVEVARCLTPEQRLGLRALPAPLPLTPAVEHAFRGVEISDRDRTLLLAHTLRWGDDLDSLLAFDGRTAEELAAEAVGALLVIRAGRVRAIDPRVAVWVEGRASTVEVTRVHARLAVVRSERGDDAEAAWHRARAALQSDAATAEVLVARARRLLRAGRLESARRLACEAAEHVSGEQRDEAMLLSGLACAGSGLVADAADALGGLFPHASATHRGRALPGLLVSLAHLRGAVPEIDPGLFRPRTAGDRSAWLDWTRAAGLAALLCAERGERSQMRAWLDAVREGAAVVGAEAQLREPVVALSWLLAGEGDVDEADGAGPVCGALLRALRFASRGDIDRGLRQLQDDTPLLVVETDPLVPGFERSPLARAYRAVAETLLLTWRGDLGSARERMLRAAVELPVALPFAGLGMVLARRLDLAVRGDVGAVARALTAVVPGGAGVDVLIDRGIEAFLDGSFDLACTAVELWVDGEAAERPFDVPGLDEVSVSGPRRAGTAIALAPPEVAVARDLQARLITAPAGGWASERDDVRERARALRTPFARARVELVLGIQLALRADHLTARVHLQRAERLFEAAGAGAWARAVRARVDRLDATAAQLVPAPERFAVCRSAWGQQLTARELDVAMLAVRGISNRHVASELNVSVRTVEVHLGRVFTKLDVRNRVELTALAHRTERHR